LREEVFLLLGARLIGQDSEVDLQMEFDDMGKKEQKKRHQRRDDGFKALESLDLSAAIRLSDLTRAMGLTSFGGRQLGEAVDVAHAMMRDTECLKVFTVSGAMTMAKMGLVICDMIDNGMVDVVVSTGALISHGLVESLGMVHYKNPGRYTDEQLYEMGYNRVYDSLEVEANLDDAGDVLFKVLDDFDKKEPTCSSEICRALGKYLSENMPGRGILKSAHDKKVPVFIPAFTDCEMGLEFFINNEIRKTERKNWIPFEPFLDLQEYARLVLERKKLGIFTVGGGVPRNWAQQALPCIDVMMHRGLVQDEKGFKRGFTYGVRICPEPAHWGGLSGCTYAEGVSWGKFVPESEGGRYAEVLCDATIAWPIIIKALMERLAER
jgi:deoxyhypusine synthase